MQLSEIKKAVISILTLVIAIGTPALDYIGVLHLPANVALIISTIVGVAGSVLHYLVPNTTTDPTVAASSSVKLVTPNRT